MKQTGFCGEKFTNTNVALGYATDSDSGRLPQQDPYPPQEVFGYEYRGMGGVVSSTTDLFDWVLALEEDKILSQAAKVKLFQPYRKNHACGWEVFTFPEGQRCVGHGGSVQGYVCKLWMFPDDDYVMIVLTNRSQFNYRILNELKWVLFDEAPARSGESKAGHRPQQFVAARIPPPSSVILEDEYLTSLAGVYESNTVPGLALRLEAKHGGLQIELFCQNASPHQEQFHKEAELAQSIMKGIAKRDTTLLAENMHPRIPAHWPNRMQENIWPNHEDCWGELDSVEFVHSASRNVEQEAWVFVWQLLHHKNGNCLSYIAFRPEQKLQLLALDANKNLCQSGEVFWPRSKMEFIPKQTKQLVSLHMLAEGGVVLKNILTDLSFGGKQPEPD